MIDISVDTNKLINEINDQLTENCPGLQVKIIKQPVSFKLCLFLNDECVSYIMIDGVGNNFNILSLTDSKYQGKGYNKFLTAVSIYLAHTMTDLNDIYSQTKVEARMHILEEYKHTKKIVVKKKKKSEDYEDHDVYTGGWIDDDDDEDEDDTYEYFVSISPENKNIAEGIINTWINNKCIKVKTGTGGKKTRRNKQKRKSKKRKTKRRK